MPANRDELLEQLKSADESDRRYAVEDLADLKDPATVPAIAKMLDDASAAVREAAVDALVSIGGEPVWTAAIPMLGSENVASRNAACQLLERVGAEAAPALAQTLERGNIDVRKFAIDVLARMKGMSAAAAPDAFAKIVATLDDPNINVAVSAAEALGLLGDEAAVEALVTHLNGPMWLQCTIISSLSQIRSPKARDALGGIDLKKLHPDAVGFYNAVVGTMS